ncbi:maleylpyruvate isomerase family mycothiol-dependent enzyme [Ornithinicoccus halotolerans]|uniref:maleylpyruvate isomerase family mycothiol-dependent enzyme n=1 Tax=Ornithinicoccus halotolerans TaxID=1748220 RepID=UPI001295C404|nr:maleylpyruvate isomerase family mycothiol-dependent enzyme [Ornithinicoccus halotolerans]
MAAALPSAAGPAGVPELALLERAVAYTRWVLPATAGTDPTAATPCRGWTLHDLLVHMTDSLAALEEAGARDQVEPSAAVTGYPRPSCPELVGVLRDRACGLLAAWTQRGGEALVDVAGSPLRAGLVAATGALEVTVHGWDLAQASGMADHRIPEPLAEDLLAYVPLLVGPGDRPVRFAAPVAPERPGAAAQLLADLGRREAR